MNTLPRILIRYDASNKVIRYAVQELKHFILKTTNNIVDENTDHDRACHAHIFTLRTDSGMKAGSFGVRSAKNETTLSGADAACVLHAIYDALERMGCHFEIDGPVLPELLNFGALADLDVTVVPFVLHRGIRQHMNFVMDISGYSIEDARNYIRNMARLKYNHITFHSYNGQWFPYRSDSNEVLAGNFYYNVKHDIPDDDTVKKVIRNRRTFCIPEAEEIMDDPAKRSAFAVAWLKDAMLQAKECGMTVQLSIEPPAFSTAENIRICEDVIRLYPMIDIFELVTPESGGEKLKLPIADEIDLMTKYFGEETRDDEGLTALFEDEMRQVTGIMKNVDRAIRAFAGIDTRLLSELGVELTLGVYSTEHKTLQIIKRLMDKFVPAGIRYAFLPAYGASAATVSIKTMDLKPRDFEKTLIYSWAEFDGSMYLLQNACTGVYDMVRHAYEVTGGGQIYGICLNHWKTAENKTCLGYAADVLIDPSVTAEDHYKRLATVYQISRKKSFVEGLKLIEASDAIARYKLFNVGFVNSGGVGRRYSVPSLDEALKMDRAIIKALTICLAGKMNAAGRDFVRLMINRVECSNEHLLFSRSNSELRSIFEGKSPEELTEAEKAAVRQKCAEARHHASGYIEKMAEIMPDRGSEGTLIDYYITVPPYISGIEKSYAGGETIRAIEPTDAESPPAPAE